MADQGRWFKLWISALSDPALDNLSLEDFARWCRFGMFMKLHGTEGTIQIPPPAEGLCHALKVPDYSALISLLERMPSYNVTGVTNATVTCPNWPKYQGDFSGDRVKRFRERVTAKKRREEKRQEEKKQPPLVPHGGTSNGFETFWTTYPRKVGKGAALKAWERLHPTNGQCEAIVAAVRVQCRCEQWTKNNGQFIPHPATWLNQRRFEDEVPAAAAPAAVPGPAGCRHCGWNLGHSPTCARPR